MLTMSQAPLTMAERREIQAGLILTFLSDAHAHGAHVYRPDELRPDVDYSQPDAPRHSGDLSELIYLYKERTYQLVINGPNMYHHLIIGTVSSPRPYRKHPPTPTPPWQADTSGGIEA